MEDHRIAALELRESPKDPSLVLEPVVRKRGSYNDVFSHPDLPLRLFGSRPGSARSTGCALTGGSHLGHKPETSSATISAAGCSCLASATLCPAHSQSASISPVVPT